MSFDPSNQSLKFRESPGTPFPKVGVALGVRGLTPSHSPTLPGVYDVTPRTSSWPAPLQPLCLGREPKVRVAIKVARISGEKNHLDVGPVERSRIYYKGEGGGFP